MINYCLSFWSSEQHFRPEHGALESVLTLVFSPRCLSGWGQQTILPVDTPE
jgi:hypothetical protein